MSGIHYLNKFLSFVPKTILLSPVWMNFTNLDHDEKLKILKIYIIIVLSFIILL
jgi:hypothetical protein